jgi:hypothetical protein
MIFYFKITKNIQKNKFYASFQFYFLSTFLVGGNLVSKYEQLLILTGIDASTLPVCKGNNGRQEMGYGKQEMDYGFRSRWGEIPRSAG